MVRSQRSGMARTVASGLRRADGGGTTLSAARLSVGACSCSASRSLAFSAWSSFSRLEGGWGPAVGLGAEADLEDATGCGRARGGESEGSGHGHGPVGDVGVEPAGEPVCPWPSGGYRERQGDAEQHGEGNDPLRRRDRLLERPGGDRQQGGSADEDDNRECRHQRAEEDAGADDPPDEESTEEEDESGADSRRAREQPHDRAARERDAPERCQCGAGRGRETASVSRQHRGPHGGRLSTEIERLTRRQLVLGALLRFDFERLEEGDALRRVEVALPLQAKLRIAPEEPARPQKPGGELVRSRVGVVGSGLGNPLQVLLEDLELDASRKRRAATPQAALSVASVRLVGVACLRERGRKLRLRRGVRLRVLDDGPLVAFSLSISSQALRPRFLDCVALLLGVRLVDEERELGKLSRETRTAAELFQAVEIECGPEDVFDTVESSPHIVTIPSIKEGCPGFTSARGREGCVESGARSATACSSACSSACSPWRDSSRPPRLRAPPRSPVARRRWTVSAPSAAESRRFGRRSAPGTF